MNPSSPPAPRTPPGPPGATRRSRCTLRLPQFLLALAFSLTTPTAPAQQIILSPIAYVTPDLAGLDRLAIVNADGSGSMLVPVNLPQPGFPVWSRDGQLLAVTSTDPGRPDKQSRNVFVVNPRNGQFTQVTRFEDQADPAVPNFSFVLPWFKAFSPDKTRLAIGAYNRAGQGAGGTGGISTVPSVQIYRADGFPEALVHLGFILDGLHHGGEGLDWDPNSNLLVFPVDHDVPLSTGPGLGEVTSLFLAEPVNDAINTGRARQLTQPRAGTESSIFTGQVLVFWEDDFAPAFSPNGAAIAYVRSYEALDNQVFPPRRPSVHSIRIVGIDGSNDREIARFQPGLYISHLSWSPNGTALAFDLGQQAVIDGSPAHLAAPGTQEVYLINVDGTALNRIRAPAAYWPAWGPFGSLFCAANGVVACPPPQITAITPAETPAGAPGLDLTITGQFLAPTAVVQWNQTILPTAYDGPGQIRAAVPPELLALPGDAQVIVTDPALPGVSNPLTFTIRSGSLPQAISISARLDGSGLVLGVQGAIESSSWTVLASANLSEWEEIGQLTVESGSGTFVIEIATGPKARFFRLRADTPEETDFAEP